MNEPPTLLNNPFYRLGASPRDDRKRLNALTDEALLLGAGDSEQALHVLLHPQQRLEAELGWFPETDGDQVRRVTDYVRGPEDAPFPELEIDDPLARFNACRALLRSWPVTNVAEAVALCESLMLVDDAMSGGEVLAAINRDRRQAGFAEARDPSEFEYRFENMRSAVAQELLDRISKLPQDGLIDVMNRLADTFVDGGVYRGGQLLALLVSGYELALGESIGRQMQIVQDYADRLSRHRIGREAHLLESATIEARDALEEWSRLTGPARRIKLARHVAGDSQDELYNLLRRCEVELNNTRHSPKCALVINKAMQGLFKYDRGKTKQIEEDQRIIVASIIASSSIGKR